MYFRIKNIVMMMLGFKCLLFALIKPFNPNFTEVSHALCFLLLQASSNS